MLAPLCAERSGVPALELLRCADPMTVAATPQPLAVRPVATRRVRRLAFTTVFPVEVGTARMRRVTLQRGWVTGGYAGAAPRRLPGAGSPPREVSSLCTASGALEHGVAIRRGLRRDRGRSVETEIMRW